MIRMHFHRRLGALDGEKLAARVDLRLAAAARLVGCVGVVCLGAGATAPYR
ncbi:MAG TPA: hypothetical protein VFK85_06680 [Anaeromyxobacteraceae bacterium]|nr:hypothetical protein [Anaeromyxobacteraceae bacterium]